MSKDEEIIVNINNKDESVRDLSGAANNSNSAMSALELEILKELERQEKAAQQKAAAQQTTQENTNTASQTGATKKIISETAQQKIQEAKPAAEQSKPKVAPTPVEIPSEEPEPVEVSYTKDKLSQRVNSSQENSKKVISQAAKKSLSPEEEKKQAEKRYADFMKQYSKKEEIVESSASAGKYDSDLDFQLNRKMKKVRFPMPKYAKFILAAAAVVLLVAVGVVLGIHFNKSAPELLLTNLTLSQPISGNCYVVNNVYVGDKLNCDDIYLTCTYSDGSTKKTPLTRDMIDVVSTTINSNDTFTQQGDALVHIKYMGKILNMKYAVQEKKLEGISLFMPSKTSTYDLVVAPAVIDLSNSLVVNATYSHGVTQKVDLSQCTYKYSSMSTPVKMNNGQITFSGLNVGQIYEVEIAYQGQTATFKVLIKN